MHSSENNHAKAVSEYQAAKEAFDELSSSMQPDAMKKWLKQEETAKKAKGKALQKLYTVDIKNENGMILM